MSSNIEYEKFNSSDTLKHAFIAWEELETECKVKIIRRILSKKKKKFKFIVGMSR